MYQVIENVLDVGNTIARRYGYAADQDYSKLGEVEAAPNEWFAGWENLGIDMHTIIKYKYYPYDFEVLRYFHKYGMRRFWAEDIWKYDWEACRQYANSLGMSNIPEYKISKQPKVVNLFMDMIADLYGYTSSLLRFFLKKI